MSDYDLLIIILFSLLLVETLLFIILLITRFNEMREVRIRLDSIDDDLDLLHEKAWKE